MAAPRLVFMDRVIFITASSWVSVHGITGVMRMAGEAIASVVVAAAGIAPVTGLDMEVDPGMEAGPEEATMRVDLVVVRGLELGPVAVVLDLVAELGLVVVLGPVAAPDLVVALDLAVVVAGPVVVAVDLVADIASWLLLR
jgi:hypothetical protein